MKLKRRNTINELLSWALSTKWNDLPIMKKRRKKEHRTQTFRAAVGAIILNENGKVLSFERMDISDAWQLPQGGLHEDETPLEAVKREVLEETGIEPKYLELLGTESRLLAYELPEEARSRETGL
jgi:8-oxo-dGTP pyrophosphatase MutT (NUDIX family)